MDANVAAACAVSGGRSVPARAQRARGWPPRGPAPRCACMLHFSTDSTVAPQPCLTETTPRSSRPRTVSRATPVLTSESTARSTSRGGNDPSAYLPVATSCKNVFSRSRCRRASAQAGLRSDDVVVPRRLAKAGTPRPRAPVASPIPLRRSCGHTRDRAASSRPGTPLSQPASIGSNTSVTTDALAQTPALPR